MTVYDEQWWEERYASGEAHWSGRPNDVLVAETADLPPGTALDVGCGTGGDALWLAEQGWRVTAVDLSRTALARAAAAAEERGVAERTRWQYADVTTWAPPRHAFDLVTTAFLHVPGGVRDAVIARLAAGVAPGGTLLVAQHDPSDLHTVRHGQDPDLFATGEQLAAALPAGEFEVLVAEARPRMGRAHEGEHLHMADAVLRARRR
ncbi:bifunctional 2-polyprenyl-6-hydroxyphenol methylase/3-demethylubiquinol 3-O-methyltransferase UbiG [Blastococcus sp. TF02A-26]|uniref:class I SAM-dependent methyltransferase n=1 Tax=Blastococcus sp. TF02A-26 TaxID=2250577 RepID=UPI000DEA61EC|nr:class I SAM-dependent methyltransferase [Blastococcus sp. TF02A-26]RBY85907.1 SAM-dependent methyltransferase [Blastococcus sp. TF02A-26]